MFLSRGKEVIYFPPFLFFICVEIFYPNVFKLGLFCCSMLEEKSKSEILSNPKNHTLVDKAFGLFKGLWYKRLESWRVRRDFQYMREAGYENCRLALEAYPRFDSAEENKKYFGFLLGKL